MNVETVFLNADLDTEIYMKMSDEMNDHVKEFLWSKNLDLNDYNSLKSVLCLHKFLYKLKQFSCKWNKNIDIKLRRLDFHWSEADFSLYILTFENDCFILLYSDNMNIIATTMNPDSDKTPRTCHIDICYHITQEALANNILKLRYIWIINMITDILMKILPRETHNCHMKTMRLDWQ